MSQKLANGSDVRLEFVYCGSGRDAQKLEEQGIGVGMSEAADRLVGVFNWVSHTWSHPNLDYLEPEECNGQLYKCATSPTRVQAELDYNLKTIAGVGINASDYLDVFKGIRVCQFVPC